MKSLITQLDILFTIHRILNDGEFHIVEDISKEIGRGERQTYDYLSLLKKFYAPVQAIPGDGYRYVLKGKGPFELLISERAVRSEIAKRAGREKAYATNRRKGKSLTKLLSINSQQNDIT